MATLRPDTLEAALARIFEGRMINRASWFALTGGEPLFQAGDPADTLYLVRSGRLGVFRLEEGQPAQFLGVVRAGEPVGEMAMLAGTPHTASVVALRDTEILALPREAFFEAARDEPDLMVELSRLMIHRARERAGGGAEPSVFGFVSARPRPIRAFVERIAAGIQALGFSCQVVDQSALSSAAEWFSRVEDEHDYVLYVAEQDQPAWAALCARQVDRLFVVGSGLLAPPAVLPHRAGFGDGRQLTDLILLRDPRMTRPANSRIWIDAIQPDRWFHCVEGVASDAERLARVITGTAVGLVLSGGGARAYCHIGAIRALREAGIHLDFIGGASMGAVVGAGPALGWDDERLDHEIRKAFVQSDPLSDLAFPLVAMTRAGKVARLLNDAYGDIDMADMPLPFFAVSSNLTSGKLMVHRTGLLRRAMRASIAIPGVMPPVVMDDQVLVDGAVLKNFPTSVMRQITRGPIVGVDMSQTRGVDPQALQNPPSWWKWIASGDWKRGPPIVSVLMRAATITTDVEMEEARADADLLVLPNPGATDIRDWKAYDEPVAAGYEAMKAALAQAPCAVADLRRRPAPEPAETATPEPPQKPRKRARAARTPS